MDVIRRSKVDNVLLERNGVQNEGILHLTLHHMIFQSPDQEELWTPYPLISLVTRLPQTNWGLSPICIRTRTFEVFILSFRSEVDATAVFDSVKDLTVTSSIEKLYAFSYVPSPPLTMSNGWSLYTPREEFARMGVGTRTKAWRFTDINKDYTFCATYPSRMVVPTKISDAVLSYAAKYRSKARIPALTYLHWGNFATITRSSQPMVGLKNSRSLQDEKLIESIFQSHLSPESALSIAVDPKPDSAAASTQANIYGSTKSNIIIDARPTANAVANVAKGAGTENMEHYKSAKKAYLGIDNIHVMRDSLGRVIEALKESESTVASTSYPQDSVNAFPTYQTTPGHIDRQALRRSNWLRHITSILEGSVIIARNIHIHSSHVLIHCSDGWDRTSQLAAVSQVMLDPFYRTFKGFQVLIEKDWLSFGHRFLDRSGHLSSDKFFLDLPSELPTNGDGQGASQAAQAFFASVQKQFASNSHVKETSPVFHQFLDCIRQIQRQYPDRFEFNEEYLRTLYYHLYACQFGTFIFNSEKERRTASGSAKPPIQLTLSVWDYLNGSDELPKYINSTFNPSLDDISSRLPGADMGVLLPNPKDVRFWHQVFNRKEEEMMLTVLAEDQPPVTVSIIDDENCTTVYQGDDLAQVDAEIHSTPPSPSNPSLPQQSYSQKQNSDTFRPFASRSSAFSLQGGPSAASSSTSQFPTTTFASRPKVGSSPSFDSSTVTTSLQEAGWGWASGALSALSSAAKEVSRVAQSVQQQATAGADVGELTFKASPLKPTFSEQREAASPLALGTDEADNVWAAVTPLRQQHKPQQPKSMSGEPPIFDNRPDHHLQGRNPQLSPPVAPGTPARVPSSHTLIPPYSPLSATPSLADLSLLDAHPSRPASRSTSTSRANAKPSAPVQWEQQKDKEGFDPLGVGPL